MIERVILMCAGRAERWGGYLGVHKHLIAIDGEMLLDRTLRLIREQTDASVTIVAFDPQYSRAGCERFEPIHGPEKFFDTDKFLSSESLWGSTGQTILLYGDVYFTEAALRTILAYEGPHQFFGRREWSYYTGRTWRELFALSFPAADRELMRASMTRLRSELQSGTIPRGGGWELYHRMHGGGWDHFVAIDDFTDDFDFPADYDRWMEKHNNRLHRMLVPVYSRLARCWHWAHQAMAPATDIWHPSEGGVN